MFVPDELRKSLPVMVVEILEDKLDKDYIDAISDMILKVPSNHSLGRGLNVEPLADISQH